MSQDNKKITFGKSLNNDSINENNASQDENSNDGQRQRIIKKLMEKYDISEKEAEAVLVSIENKDKIPDKETDTKPAKKDTQVNNNVNKKEGPKGNVKPTKKPETEDNQVSDNVKQKSEGTFKPTKKPARRPNLKKLDQYDDVDVIIPQHVLDREKQENENKSNASDSRKISDIIPEISEGSDKPNPVEPVSLKDNISDSGDEVVSLKDNVMAATDSKSKSLKKDEGAENKSKLSSLKKMVSNVGSKPKSLKKDDVNSSLTKPKSLKRVEDVKDGVDDSVSKPKSLKRVGDVKDGVDDSSSNHKPLEKADVVEDQSAVDSLVSDIVPGYQSNVSIEVENVDLSFDVATDRIDTLKESVIRTIKRTKHKKIKFQALKDISFKIYQGEKVGIIGYNGAGKSTLLKVITGIYPPDNGKVITRGNISPLLSLGAGFDRNYSGRKNIYLNGAVLGYSKKFLQEKEEEIIEFSELEEFIDFPIRNYSSGMIAKLGFSIATMVNPDILIIDEILSVGDVNFKRKSSDKIKSLMDGKTTVVLVSHSIPQIRSLCDRAIWIDKGEIREIGDVNEVCNHYLKDSEKASKEQLRNIQFR